MTTLIDDPPLSAVTPAPVDESEALFKEARRRRRRRRAWMAGGIVLVLAVATVALDAARGHTVGPPTSPALRPGSPRAVPGPPSPDNRAAATNPSYTAVQEAGLADSSLGWVADGTAIDVTSDRGRSWRTVTPPIFTGQAPSERIDAMVGVGSTDLWLPVVDVIGLFPMEKGMASDRFNGIERSTGGGATWTFTALPGCLQSCGADISLSFPDAQHGFALEGTVKGRATLFSTVDGGATWTREGTLPGIGSLSLGGGQMVFTDPHHGWATSGPTFGPGGQMASSGGELYRTSNGGTTWSRASGLPATNRYGTPTFFGIGHGVTVGYPEGRSSRTAQVFVTGDGGATWTAHRLPTDPGLADYHQDGVGIPFAALGPSSWKVFVGPVLYSTRNAGRTWQPSVSAPRLKAGTINTIVFESDGDGMALALQPGCPDPTGGSAAEQCYSVLLATTDGGGHWAPRTP
jgi:photosystem II stability/assembly factor-like uncharacterized protein